MNFELEHLRADLFGLNATARRALSERPSPRGFDGLRIPDTIEGWPRPEDRLEPDSRKELASVLTRALAAFEPHVAVLDAARSLAEPGTFVVVAGQQPGFLGGPLYNVHKALHAIRLARALGEAWGTSVVPIFWNHADDHDVAEVHHLWIQNPNLDLRKVGLAGLSSGRRPLSRIILDTETHQLEAVRALLVQDLALDEAGVRRLDTFLPRTGESMSNAFTRHLLEVFGRFGLVVVEPDWIREELSRALANLVTRDVRGALHAGEENLRANDLEPAIEGETAALCFHLEDGERRALRFAEDGYRLDGEPGSRTSAELAAEIVQAPADWSPGALLRPILQDRVLPTAAYVGGFGELAYHVQLPALRREAGGALPPFVPRLSMTWLDAPTRVALERLDWNVRDVLAGNPALAADPRGAESEPDVLTHLTTLASRTREDLFGLREDLAALDPGLASQLKRAANSVRDVIEKLATKARRVHDNQSGRGRRHERRIQNALLPRGQPQERVRGLIEFALRGELDWLEALLAELEPLPLEHVVLSLSEPESNSHPT